MPNYRRIIDAYRTKLMEVSPSACNEVDDALWQAGEGWVSDQRPVDPDALLSAKEIAERFGLEVHNIRAWARRHPDKIKTHKKGNHVLFRLREVMQFMG